MIRLVSHSKDGEPNVCFCRLIQIGAERGFSGGRPFFSPGVYPAGQSTLLPRIVGLRSSGLVLHNAVIIDTHISLSTERFNP